MDDHINLIYKTVLGSDNLLELLQVMNSLLCNIINKPEEQKFRTVKLTNPKIAASLGRSPPAISLFKHLCFVESGEGLLQFAGDSTSELNFTARSIREFAEKIRRLIITSVSHQKNHGVAGFSSTAGQTNADVAAKHGGGSGHVMDTLQAVKMQRAVA